MIKHIPSYQEFIYLNEGSETFRFAERYRFDNMNWKFDQKAKDELEKEIEGSSNVKVYKTSDKERGREYTFETWNKNLDLFILVKEDDLIIYSQVYPLQLKRHFVQDCEMILGFEIKDTK
jgi:hypothetical protein